MFFKERKKTYSAGEGPVRYLDGTSLLRPFSMEKPQLFIMGVFVIAAIIIGGFFLYNTIDSVAHSSERAQASVEANLARPAAIESLPVLSSLVGMSAEDIFATFEGAGYAVLDYNALKGNTDGGIDYIKLPADVDSIRAGAMYQQGVNKLSAADATLLLNGSWRFVEEPGDTLNMSVKYADFSSGSLSAAIQAAIATEGFDASELGEPGVDESGNTFLAGTVAIGEETYSWRVSAIALSSMYTVKGLPETAAYVGVRLYQ